MRAIQEHGGRERAAAIGPAAIGPAAEHAIAKHPTPVRAAGDRSAAPRRERASDVLSLHAGVLASMRQRGPTPESWRTTRFERDVELVRVHLALLASCDLLVDSFRRESAYLLVTRHLSVADAEHVLATSAVDVAYAIRWLELTGTARPAAWTDWIRPSVAVAAAGEP